MREWKEKKNTVTKISKNIYWSYNIQIIHIKILLPGGLLAKSESLGPELSTFIPWSPDIDDWSLSSRPPGRGSEELKEK